jgi:hypothetical protein
MPIWDRGKAIAAFEAFQLIGTNAELAVYWLSLWSGDLPPRRSDFNPARVKTLLPAIAVTEVRDNGDAVCRLSGGFIDMALGVPMRGVNVLALVDGKQRQVRSARLGAIVGGGVALSRVHYPTHENGRQIAETIQLPFYGVLEDGSRQYLTHTNWRPRPADYRASRGAPRNVTPDEYRAVALA